MLSLPELILKVKVDDKAAKTGLKGVEKSANEAAGGIGAKFAGLGKSIAKSLGKIAVAGAVALSAALVKITKDAFKATSEYEQLSEGLKLSMGDAYDYLEEKASNAWKTMGLSMNDYYDQASNLSVGLKNALGGDTQAAAELTDKILTAEADISAATGQTQENVQNAFNGIMRGNFTMIDNLRLGIQPTKEGYQEMIDKVNEWNAAQGHATEYQMGNYADMYNALTDYVEMQGMAGYAAEEAADTIQGSINSMKASWENLLTTLGSGDDAKIQEATQNLVESIGNVLKNSIPIIKNIFKGIGTALIESFGEIDGEALRTKIGETLSKIGTWISEKVPEAINNLASSLADILNSGFGPEGQIASPIMLGLKDLLKGIFEAILKAIPGLLALAGELLVVLAELVEIILEALLEAIANVFVQIWTAIEPYLSQGWEAIKNWFFGLINGIKEWFQNIYDTIKSKVKAAKDAVVNTFKNMYEAIKTRVKAIKDTVTTVFNNIKESIKTRISSIYENAKSIFNKIKSAITTPIENAKDKVKGIVDKIKSFFTGLKIKLPNIPLPHFSVSPSGWKIGDLLKGSIPKLSIDWYAQGGFFNGPTILSGLGEAGPEYALPLSRPTLAPLAQMLNELMQADKSSSSSDEQIIIVNTSLEIDGRQVAKTTAPYMKKEITKISTADARQLGLI